MMTMASHRLLVADAELHSSSRAEQIMVMQAVRPHRWTTEEVDRLVDEREGLSPRYELVDGELLVTPAPSRRHQRIILRLAFVLSRYLVREGLGEICLGPGDIRLVSGSRFEPDLFVVPAPGGRLPAAKDPVPNPLLICEVLSPGSVRHDRFTKSRAFQAHAVPEYWVVDGDAEAFEIWHPGDERATLVDERVMWRPAGARDAFELEVKRFFADLADNARLS